MNNFSFLRTAHTGLFNEFACDRIVPEDGKPQAQVKATENPGSELPKHYAGTAVQTPMEMYAF